VTDDDYDLTAVTNGDSAAASVPNGELLVRFAEAVLGDDAPTLAQVRQQLRDTMGEEVLGDVAATVASFNSVVILADGSGIPLEDYKEEATKDLREQLGLDRLHS
jgi:hypothetical protein